MARGVIPTSDDIIFGRIILHHRIRTFADKLQKLTMSLESNINEDLKNAMKAKDQVGLRGIRAIKSAIMLYNTSGTTEELSSEKK